MSRASTTHPTTANKYTGCLGIYDTTCIYCLNNFFLIKIKGIFITVLYYVNMNSTNSTNSYCHCWQIEHCFENTTKKRVRQYNVIFINDNVNGMRDIPHNNQCTHPIFSNLLTIREICCLLGCFTLGYSYFINRTIISGTLIWKKRSFKSKNSCTIHLE